MSVDLAISLLLALAKNAGQISVVVSKAQAEGRNKLTADEWALILADDDLAAIKQQAALEKARAEGR